MYKIIAISLFIICVYPLYIYAEYGLPFYQDLSKLEEYVSKHTTNLDLAKIIEKDSRVIYLGESHADTASKNFVTRNMNELKQLGITHIGLEMFDQSQQRLLDDYEKGIKTERDIFEYLSREWGYLPEYYTNLIKAARSANIKLVALDGRVPSKTSETESRDQAMARRIAHLVHKSASTRVVVLIGYAHIDTELDFQVQYQPEILERSFGIVSTTYRIEPQLLEFTSFRPKPNSGVTLYNPTGPNPDWIEETRYVQNKSVLRKALLDQGVPMTNTFLPLSRNEAGFDGFIFVDSYTDDLSAAESAHPRH